MMYHMWTSPKDIMQEENLGKNCREKRESMNALTASRDGWRTEEVVTVALGRCKSGAKEGSQGVVHSRKQTRFGG